MYEHFEMREMFEDQCVHDTLVRVAFHVAAQDFGDGTAGIRSVSTFGQFLRAYLAVLGLYHETMLCEGIAAGTDPRYGASAPDLNRGVLTQVLKAVGDGGGGGGDAAHDNRVAHFVHSLFGSGDDSHPVPFLEIADPWAALLLGGGSKDKLKDISELFYALGLSDNNGRASVFSLLVASGLNANDADAMFNALKAKVDLSGYCYAAESAGNCARRVWVKECEQWVREGAPASVNTGDATDDHDAKGSRILADIHLRRLLHGVYGTMVAAVVLEKTLLQDAADGSKHSDTPAWDLETTVPTQACSNLLREAAAMLKIQDIGEVPANAFEKSDKHSGVDAAAQMCVTASLLVQHISLQYVNSKMQQWREEAWRRLQAAWPVSSEDARMEAFFNALMQRAGRHDETHLRVSENLYEQYASDVLLVMSNREFQVLCCKALFAVGDPGGNIFTSEDIPAFLRYILGYTHVLISFGVPHNGRVCGATSPTWEELEVWVRRETGAAMDGAVRAVFKHLTSPSGNAVPLEEVAVWFAGRAALQGTSGVRLRIWRHQLRDMIPAGDAAGDSKKCRETANEIRTADGYITLSSLAELCSSRYQLWRVWPPDLGSSFVAFSLWETNKVLRRMELRDGVLHYTDLRFLLLFVRSYLDVLLDGACVVEVEEGDKATGSKAQHPFAARPVIWTDDAMRPALQTLLRGRNLDEEILLQMVLGCETALCTTAHVALTVARATVGDALKRFRENASGSTWPDSLWDRLRQRLPSVDSTEQRLKRQELFALIDVRGARLLTLCDLYRGMVEQLSLHEFREDLQPIVFRAFFATKEVAFLQQSAVYLTDGEEQFITAAEFRTFLWYMYAYFELYHMFDALCKYNEDPVKKSVSLEAFVAAAPLLWLWGCHFADPAAEFRGINRRCKEGGAMYFTDFAVWASQHHLSPAGHFHEEATEEEAAAVWSQRRN
ncbi:hypothetical protein TRSC58_05937 [Trypanosoma rangeli SC58]|uniref:Flagellar calcium-binding protein EF-hand domain-containing protein n=1 Tax=Trypanosoma rangeli SC58 TaxID=429131 RepID=A0A061IWW3_TRYRA|nr:hypothetical protein TRSC58_05937 [Trypanosoma rangeli SC58]